MCVRERLGNVLRHKKQLKTDLTAMFYITLVDDETVQDDSEKEFLVYEGINFLMFYTLELIILVYLIKISLRAYYVTRH